MANKNSKRSNQAGAGMAKGKHSIKRYFYAKEWDTSFRLYSLDPNVVAYRLENNLSIDDLYDTLDKKYVRGKQKVIPTHRICSRCSKEKSIDNYYQVNGYYQTYCKKCQKK